MDTANDRQAESNGVSPAGEMLVAAVAPRRVLVVGADAALFALLQEWLGECACTAVEASAARKQDRFELVIVEIPFPRQGGVELVKQIANEHPGAPILALSSCFFAGIACRGEVARGLGVASVLPKPVSRDALLSAVRSLLKQ